MTRRMSKHNTFSLISFLFGWFINGLSNALSFKNWAFKTAIIFTDSNFARRKCRVPSDIFDGWSWAILLLTHLKTINIPRLLAETTTTQLKFLTEGTQSVSPIFWIQGAREGVETSNLRPEHAIQHLLFGKQVNVCSSEPHHTSLPYSYTEVYLDARQNPGNWRKLPILNYYLYLLNLILVIFYEIKYCQRLLLVFYSFWVTASLLRSSGLCSVFRLI